jgi:poly(rC)-binding protein 3/4
MEAVLRIFKRINGISEPGTENMASGAQVPAICAIRLLVVSSQAVNLIGKQGSSIKSIQEASGATIRIITPGMCFIITSALRFSFVLQYLIRQLETNGR